MTDTENNVQNSDTQPKKTVGKPFEKGKSGNPGGRPKGVSEIRELAQSYAPQAVEALVLSLVDPKTRVQAANVLLDRGYGKAPQSLDLNHGVQDTLGDLLREISGKSRGIPK